LFSSAGEGRVRLGELDRKIVLVGHHREHEVGTQAIRFNQAGMQYLANAEITVAGKTHQRGHHRIAICSRGLGVIHERAELAGQRQAVLNRPMIDHLFED
jgi:hypothetical protein